MAAKHKTVAPPPGAVELRDRIAEGALRAADAAEAHIEMVERLEPEVHAFSWFDPDFVRHQAKQLDLIRGQGKALGRLHGVPVGVKDIIDTRKIPTENGTALDKGRVPRDDAWLVARLKAEGALLMGKTVTTELAFMGARETRNPHNLAHTPGGSSSGSAAAVAAGMVPVAVGTQTGGSVIRPASFCGVVGFKPTFGAVPRTGVLKQAHSLDTVGFFGRSVADVAALAEVLFGHDPDDPATAPAPQPDLLAIAQARPPVTPELAFVKSPAWEQADEDMKAGLGELAEALGDKCVAVDLPEAFGEALNAHRRVQFAEMAKNYFHYAERGIDTLGPEVREGIETGNAIPARDYLSALDWKALLGTALNEIFERFDAIITPAAAGPAPEGLSSTGNPAFNGIWTFAGNPAVTLPLLQASNGLPMGVQVVGKLGDDARLLRTANWLSQHVAGLS